MLAYWRCRGRANCLLAVHIVITYAHFKDVRLPLHGNSASSAEICPVLFVENVGVNDSTVKNNEVLTALKSFAQVQRGNSYWLISIPGHVDGNWKRRVWKNSASVKPVVGMTYRKIEGRHLALHKCSSN